jgi:alpha-1,2-mannosyltransferase
VRQSAAFAGLLAAVTVFAASVLVYRQVTASDPGLWTHTDEWVYRAAGMLARRRPADLYRALMGEPGSFKLPFTYPPFAAVVFALGSPFSFGTWQIALVVIDLILLPVIIYASLRISGHRGRRGAALALVLAAMAIWLEPVYMTMFFGQINLILLALIIVDLALPNSSQWKGVGIGIAAGLKLTPLIFIPYLVASRRVRAGVVGLLSFAGTAVIGFVVLPVASRAYWGGKFDTHGGPERLVNQSINGVVQRLLHGDPSATKLWTVLAVVVAAAGLATAVWASRRELELLGIVLCGVTGLLVSPISWSHHWVWVVPALALMAGGGSRGGAGADGRAGICPRDWISRAAGAAAILALFAMWPAPSRAGRVTIWLPHGLLRFAPHDNDLEYTWHGATLLLGNSYVIAGVAAIAGAAGYLWVTRDRAPFRPASSGTGDQLHDSKIAVIGAPRTRAGDG